MPAREDHPGVILVVGRGSFLAGHFLAALPAERVRAVGHDQIERPDLLDGIACVVNFARHPLLGRDGYQVEAMDADLRLARRIGGHDVAYVMLSSRKVYAPSDFPLAETAPTGPSDAYGRHKLEVEERLGGLLGERLTVLRLANVFGYERTLGRRTFLGLTLDRLAREGAIHYDMSPFVERDFLPVEALVRLLVKIAEAPPGGILNVGSGIGLPTGRLALWILEGFGRGRLVIDSPRERDPFVLDVTRLRSLYGAPCSLDELRTACLDLGRRLAAEPRDRERHSGEAMAKRRAFSFHQEPRGDLYRAVIDLGSLHCPTALLAVRDAGTLSAAGQQALESLTAFLIDAQEATSWPGTILHSGKAVIYRYRTTPELTVSFKRLAEGLYSWQHPDLPEDLCFLRSDGTPWLASVAHEGDAYLEITDDEMRELLNVEPRIADYISAD